MLLETWLTFKCMLLIKIQIIHKFLLMLVVAWTMPTYRGTSLVRLVVSTSQVEHCFSTPTLAWIREINHPNSRTPTVCKTIFSDSEECTKNRKCFSIFYQSLVLSLIRQFSIMRASESTETFFSAIYKS